MSTVKTNNVQVGTSGTATNNFTWYQPATPDGTVRLGVGNTGATTADVVTANSSGNVGIGTSSPGYKLTVNGRMSYSGAIGEGADTTLSSAGTSVRIADSATWQTLALYTNGSERARIDSSGNLLVGTTSNTYGARVTSNIDNASWSYASNQTGSGTFYHMTFRVAGTGVGSIQSSSTTTSYNTSSDHRLKEDIAPMTGALAKVQALKPVTYKWKADGSDGQGFIAHELQEVVPDCVTGEKDAVETYTDDEGNEQTRPVYQGVDTSFLVATLTAAIQEQQATIESLTARIAALESK